MSDDDKLARSTRRYLEQIPDLFARLPQHIRPGSRPADPDRVSTSTSPSRPPVNLDVIDLLDDREKPDAEPTRGDYDLDRRAGARRQGILPTLSSWVRLVDSERWDEGDEHQNPPTQRTVAGECGWLVEALDWIVEQRWLYEFEDDLARMVKDMKRALGETEPKLMTTCPKCGWEMAGQGDYDAERKRHPWYHCTGCGHNLTTAAEIDRAERAAYDLVTLKYAAKELGKPFSTLRRWKQEGWITPRGKDRRGEIYSINAIRIVAQSVTNGKKHRAA